MNRIEQTFIIHASPEEVWQALTEPDFIAQWSGAPAEFSAAPDTEYSLWGGDIRGRVLEVVPMQRLVQSWEPKNWNLINSVVTFVLAPSDEGTRVDLTHENVEEWDYDGTNEGWDIYYLGALKHMLESREGAPEKQKPAKKRTTKKTAAKKTGAKKTAAKAKRTPARKATTKKSASKKRAAKKK